MSSLGRLGEFGFIAKVAQMAGVPSGELCQAIGDDCAVIDVGADFKLLVTTDAALQGRHFDLAWMTPYEAGGRAVAGALSDIAAMGGRPLACFCTAMIPPSAETDLALEMMRGVADTARHYGAPLAGGDTVAAFDHMALDIAVVGRAQDPWLRSGARPGDVLALTGRLGETGAALHVAQHAPGLLTESDLAHLRARLTTPTPRLAEADILARTGLVHAAIDISDGLYQDAAHIARNSTVRMELGLPRLPLVDLTVITRQARPPAEPWELAGAGEDYELLLAIEPGSHETLASLLREEGLAPLTEIGRVAEGEGVALLGEDGEEISLPRTGWDHFKSPPA